MLNLKCPFLLVALMSIALLTETNLACVSSSVILLCISSDIRWDWKPSGYTFKRLRILLDIVEKDKISSTSLLKVYFSDQDKILPEKACKRFDKGVILDWLQSQIFGNSHVKNFYQGNFSGRAWLPHENLQAIIKYFPIFRKYFQARYVGVIHISDRWHWFACG